MPLLGVEMPLWLVRCLVEVLEFHLLLCEMHLRELEMHLQTLESPLSELEMCLQGRVFYF